MRECVKAIQEDREKRPAPVAQQRQGENPYGTVQQMMGKPPRVPSGLNTPPGDAQPFDYQPDALADAEQDAGVFLTPAEEAKCDAGLEADLAECSACAAIDKSYWWPCHDRSMQRYSNCLRGRGID